MNSRRPSLDQINRIRRILKLVAASADHPVKPSAFLNGSRCRTTAPDRHLAIYLVHHSGNLTHAAVAGIFGNNERSVRLAITLTEARLRNPDFNRRALQIAEQLETPTAK
jgi:hypothetical protein